LKRLVPVAIAAAALVGVTASSASAAPRVNMHIGNPTNAETVTEAGSSLLEPFLSELVTPLSAADPNITFAPAAGGSGLGITNATTGVSDLGGTDAYLAPAEFTPGVQNIPVAVSSQSVDYNLPGIKNLKLSGSIIAQIFQGTVTTWNAPAIAKLNPGVTLPSTRAPLRLVWRHVPLHQLPLGHQQGVGGGPGVQHHGGLAHRVR
jgi:ABC-type phosphate transport system substrate-binding protein